MTCNFWDENTYECGKSDGCTCVDPAKNRSEWRADSKKAKDSKHISQLKGMDQARAQQYIQFALLAIVQSQGKPVSIPIEHADKIFDTHRLKLEVVDGNIILDVEEQGSNIIKPSDMIQ